MKVSGAFAAAFVVVSAIASSAGLTEPVTPVGVRHLTTTAPARGQPIGITLYYPAEAGGTPVTVGGSKVFEGAAAQEEAPIAAGVFPLVLLSHGGMRSAPDSDAWLAANLAARGFIAASVRGPDVEDASLAVREIWLRPADLSAALTAVQADPALAEHLKPDATDAVGLFLGGTSVLVLAGADFDAAAFAESCDSPRTGPDCGWYRESGVDLHTVDTSDLMALQADPRIKSVIAVEPELGDNFAPASLAAINVPVAIIDLEAGAAADPGGKQIVPQARYETILGASPFSAFNLCTPKGAAILAEEGNAAPCEDGEGRPRAAIHEELADMIAGMLTEMIGEGGR